MGPEQVLPRRVIRDLEIIAAKEWLPLALEVEPHNLMQSIIIDKWSNR